MKRNKEFIRAKRELQHEIAEAFGVTIRTVEVALAFTTNSPTARLIRSYAIENGARLIEENDVTDMRAVKIIDAKGKVIISKPAKHPSL
ncbi:MAG: hypothetical protein ACRCUJ_01610 [Phocaeicola sp.]